MKLKLKLGFTSVVLTIEVYGISIGHGDHAKFPLSLCLAALGSTPMADQHRFDRMPTP